ncbi:MAG TPA: hypothetical protein VFL57_14055 [Bryobacteraceae bacterium]|nr:hypothetical protein [Bryobacteraceae bacterium]
MPSQRQLDANRKNAARGGPRTPEGRAAVRFNRLVHGLTAATPVLPGEDPKAFEQFREDLFQDYLPANHTERLLFENLVVCSWRLLRLRRVETETWSAYILAIRHRDGADQPPTQQEADRALAGALAELPANNLANFFRYERMTTRDFYRALHELEAAQRERRRGQPIPAAAPAPKTQPELAAAASGGSAAQASAPETHTQSSEAAAEVSEIGIRTVSSTNPQHVPAAPPELIVGEKAA